MAGAWLLLRLPLAVMALCAQAQAAAGDGPARAALASAKAKGNNGLARGKGNGRPPSPAEPADNVLPTDVVDYEGTDGAGGNELEDTDAGQDYDELESLPPELQDFAAMHPDLWEKIKPDNVFDKAQNVEQQQAQAQAQLRTMDDYLALREALPRRDTFPSEELMQLRLQVMFDYMDRLGIVPVGTSLAEFMRRRTLLGGRRT